MKNQLKELLKANAEFYPYDVYTELDFEVLISDLVQIISSKKEVEEALANPIYRDNLIKLISYMYFVNHIDNKETETSKVGQVYEQYKQTQLYHL